MNNDYGYPGMPPMTLAELWDRGHFDTKGKVSGADKVAETDICLNITTDTKTSYPDRFIVLNKKNRFVGARRLAGKAKCNTFRDGLSKFLSSLELRFRGVLKNKRKKGPRGHYSVRVKLNQKGEKWGRLRLLSMGHPTDFVPNNRSDMFLNYSIDFTNVDLSVTNRE